MALRNNGTARSARRIAIFALLFDIVSFGFQGGLIFVAIGHDANSLTECTSTNGLCPSPTIQGPNTASCTVAINGFTCTTATINFAPAYVNKPVVTVFETLSNLVPNHNYAVPGATVSNLITFQTPGNSTILLYDNEVASTITIPVTDTILKQYNPSGNEPFANVIVEGEGYITLTALTATRQDTSIKIEDCNLASVFQTIKFNPETISVGAKIPFAIKGVVPAGGFGLCASINVQAPAADANTSITLVSLRVYGVETNFQVWQNMPAALTEIYGSTNDEQHFSFVSTASSTVTFCVNVVSLSTGTGTYLSPYYGTTELSSSLRVVIDGTGAVGLRCTAANTAIPSGDQMVTVKGASGSGLGDLPAFGAISLSWQQTNPSTSISVAVGYSHDVLSLTPTSFQLRIRFTQTLSASNTVTFTWQSIGT